MTILMIGTTELLLVGELALSLAYIIVILLVLILCDVSDNGKVDIADVNAVINIMLGKNV